MRKGDDLTTFTAPKVEKIRSLKIPDYQGPAQACSRKTLPFTDPIRRQKRIVDGDKYKHPNVLVWSRTACIQTVVGQLYAVTQAKCENRRKMFCRHLGVSVRVRIETSDLKDDNQGLSARGKYRQ